MTTISLTLNESEIRKVCLELETYSIANANAVIRHGFKLPEGRVTIFNTGVMTIQGNDVNAIYKRLFKKNYQSTDNLSVKKPTRTGIQFNQLATNSIGSDEVGVGDFFGGLVVAAAYVEIEQVKWLQEVGVTDSKLLTDQKILDIYDQIRKRVNHVVVIASPVDYNNMFDEYQNSHVIKAVMHNKALTKLSSKISTHYFTVIDEFATPANYDKYLIKAKVHPVKIDLSLTKAESQYLCVACASIFARVHFLKQIDALSKQLQIQLPLGSSNVTIPLISKKIIQKIGKDNLSNYCKKHFITYNRVIGD